MSSINSQLKEAREAIKNKDYALCLKSCKSILKEDKSNYMALVFLGISFQETGQLEQAPKAFRKAIEKDSTNPLAWNGLACYYEKLENDNKSENLLDVYVALIGLTQDSKKKLELCQKISALPLVNDHANKAVETICNVANQKEDGISSSCLEYLLTFFKNVKELTDELLAMFDDLLSNIADVKVAYYLDYVKLLDSHKKYEKVLQVSSKMCHLFPNDRACVEWMCYSFAILFVQSDPCIEGIEKDVKEMSENLLNGDSKSSAGNFALACIHYQAGELPQTKNLLEKVVSIKTKWIYAWILLLKCVSQMEVYEEGADFARKAHQCLNNTSNEVNKYLIDALSRSNSSEDWNLALKISETHDFISGKCRAFINLKNQQTEVDKCLDILKENNFENYVNLSAYSMILNQNYLDASKFLEENIIESSSEYWLQYSSVLIALDKYKEALVPLLKSAKLNPNSYKSFLMLGNYYQKFNNLEKARRCYEKAFKINNRCQEAGIALSKIYRQLKNWDANIILLENLTVGKINTNNKWAYLQLGLHYLEHEEYYKAIDTLQFIVRYDPDNCHYWEALADAYMLRGALTSALKCYQKACELSDNTLYPLLQIADIKKTMRLYTEAKEDFEKILLSNHKYVPALKGLAETCLNLAHYYRRRQLIGRAKECVQESFNNAAMAIMQENNISCLWKILADCCKLAARMPEKYSYLSVDLTIIEGKNVEGSKIVETDDLFGLAERFYCKSLSLVNDNLLIWHDLATTYFLHSQYCKDDVLRKALHEKALLSIRHCIHGNPTYWQHWNLLGVITFYSEPKNFALSQHAFIKAVTLDMNSAMAWTNLGVLYLHLDNIRLANKAFSQAQRADPNYANSWVGQALIAESCGYDDGIYLFRNSIQLTHLQEGALGYGHWVCKTLIENPPDAVLYTIQNMHAVPVAMDSLTWYTENNPDNACAWNMLGLLNERMGLKETANRAFKTSLSLTENNESRDKAYINYGRSLAKLGKYEEAIQIFKSVQDTRFNNVIGLALALFKDEQFEESYEAYEAALHITDKPSYQSDLLVALASMAYLFQGTEEAKTLLFQSTQLKPRSPWGLYATLSLGLLHDDINLANLVLKEFKDLQNDKSSHCHVALLTSLTYLMQNDFVKAKREVCRLIHRYPDESTLWLNIAVLLLRTENCRQWSNAAMKCSQRAIQLGQSKTDITKELCIASLAAYTNGDYKEALRSAQIAIHMYPNAADSWVMLLLSLLSTNQADKMSDKICFVQSNLNPPKPLHDWLNKFSIAVKC